MDSVVRCSGRCTRSDHREGKLVNSLKAVFLKLIWIQRDRVRSVGRAAVEQEVPNREVSCVPDERKEYSRRVQLIQA